MIIKGERIEDLLPSENSWNSGLVAVKVGIFFHILVFIVKKVTWRWLMRNIFSHQVHSLRSSSYVTRLRLSLLDNFLNVYTVRPQRGICVIYDQYTKNTSTYLDGRNK